MTDNIIGANIRRLREAEGLTQSALADATGCREKQISHWERGRNVPSLRYLLALASALSVTVEELAHDNDT